MLKAVHHHNISFSIRLLTNQTIQEDLRLLKITDKMALGLQTRHYLREMPSHLMMISNDSISVEIVMRVEQVNLKMKNDLQI